VAWRGTCRWWCSNVSAALVLLDGSGHGFGRCCLRIVGELLQWTAATERQWWRERMFMAVVPIKQGALS